MKGSIERKKEARKRKIQTFKHLNKVQQKPVLVQTERINEYLFVRTNAGSWTLSKKAIRT